jgi:alpha-beta hydrolase superfamily lysophospholipase
LQTFKAQKLLIYLHKNADDLGLCRSFCRKLGDSLGVHVLVVEYPGYGLCSASAPSASQVIKHVFAALAFVQKALNWPLDNVLLFGVSLGAGPALAVAAEVEVAGLVLVAPFLNLRQMFRDHVGRLASLVAEQFPNDKLVADIRSPTLIFHGKQDKMVPVVHGETLYKSLKCRSKLVSPPEATHHTNLLQDDHLLVAPMKDLFCLPGQGSGSARLVVPQWAFHRRLCLLVSAPES